MKAIIVLMLILFSTTIFADLSQYQFADKKQAKDFKELLSEIRCLVCQNQSLADSDADLAEDLRLEVYNLKQAGNTDAQVMDFLVTRYGDFVLYRPPLKPSTYLLWFGPLIAFFLLIIFVIRAIRKQGQQADVLSAVGKQQAADLLKQDKNEG